MEKIIKEVQYNWCPPFRLDSESNWDWFNSHTVGEGGVKEIAMGGNYGGSFCTVIFDDGHEEIVFNLNRIIFKESESAECEYCRINFHKSPGYPAFCSEDCCIEAYRIEAADGDTGA